MNKCDICGKDFESKRADAKYCSASCRKKASRGVGDKKISPPETKQESQKNTKNKPEVLDHPIKRPPKPDYMTDYDYSRWDGVECKFGACLNRKCPYRVRT